MQPRETICLSDMENLKHFIRKHYGTQKQCAQELGVTSNTVSNWLHKNPSGMLKHMRKIVQDKDTTPTELMSEVYYHEGTLKRE